MLAHLIRKEILDHILGFRFLNLVLLAILGFAGAYVTILRYDVR